MPSLDATLLVLGATTFLLAALSTPIKSRLWLSEPMIATGVGVLVGPAVAGWLDPAAWGDDRVLLREVARLTLGASLVSTALRLPDTFIPRHLRSLALVLGPLMIGMWVVSSVAAKLALGLPWLAALLLGAVVTPTDPVLAGTIVTGKLAKEAISAETRHLLSAESGANDGLAFLLVMLPYHLMHAEPGEALRAWALESLLREVVGGVLLGVVVGWVVGRGLLLLARDEDRRMSSGPLLVVSLAMALALLGGARLMHLDGILAVFAAGLVYNHALEGQGEEEQADVDEAMKKFFTVPVFVLFGALLPWGAWGELGLGGVLFALVAVTLRRLPVVLMLRRGVRPLRTRADARLYGWFGPIGVAAIVYGAWADLHGAQHPLWPAASLAILVSIVVHGATATPFTRRHGAARAATARGISG